MSKQDIGMNREARILASSLPVQGLTPVERAKKHRHLPIGSAQAASAPSSAANESSIRAPNKQDIGISRVADLLTETGALVARCELLLFRLPKGMRRVLAFKQATNKKESWTLYSS